MQSSLFLGFGLSRLWLGFHFSLALRSFPFKGRWIQVHLWEKSQLPFAILFIFKNKSLTILHTYVLPFFFFGTIARGTETKRARNSEKGKLLGWKGYSRYMGETQMKEWPIKPASKPLLPILGHSKFQTCPINFARQELMTITSTSFCDKQMPT